MVSTPFLTDFAYNPHLAFPLPPQGGQSVDYQSQNYQNPQNPYEPPVTPRRRFDPLTLGIIAAAGAAGGLCVAALSLLCIFVFLAPPPPPATPKAIINTTNLAATNPNLALPTGIPTLDPASVGKVINPMVSADLQGMTVMQIDVLDQASGN